MSSIEVNETHCVVCGDELPENVKRHHGFLCSRKCKKRRQSENYHKENPPSEICSATVGTIGELRVSLDLLTKGYEVFRAMSPAASCDLAVLKNGKLLRIEVRTSHYDAKGKPYASKAQDNHRADILAKVLPDKIFYYPELT
jgi:predicted nucleic acid-binding Zn ribbon protein